MQYHMQIDIKGLLLRKDRELRGLLRKDGKRVTAAEARLYLMEHLQKGHSYIPFGKCDNFDYVNGGCLGHEEAPCTNS